MPDSVPVPLLALAAYYNPFRGENRRRNYEVFRQHVGVPLVTVEWSPDGRYDLSPDDADGAFAELQIVRAVPADAPECIRLRGMTRENAVAEDRLRAYGITAASRSVSRIAR